VALGFKPAAHAFGDGAARVTYFDGFDFHRRLRYLPLALSPEPQR
jgi:hypothetical protein